MICRKWRKGSSLIAGIRSAFSSKYPLNILMFRSEEQLQEVRQSLRRRFRDEHLADRIVASDKKLRTLNYNLEQHRK